MSGPTLATLIDDADWAVRAESTSAGVAWDQSLHGALTTTLAGHRLLMALAPLARPGRAASAPDLKHPRRAEEAMADLVGLTEAVLPHESTQSPALLEAAAALDACLHHLPEDAGAAADAAGRVNRVLCAVAEHALWLLATQAPHRRFHTLGSCARAWVTVWHDVSGAPQRGAPRHPRMDGTLTHVLAGARVLTRRTLRERSPGHLDVDAALGLLDDASAMLTTWPQQSARRSFWGELPEGLRTRHPSSPGYLTMIETARTRIVTHRAPLSQTERIAVVATVGFVIAEVLAAWRTLTEHLGLVVPTHRVPLETGRIDPGSFHLATAYPDWAPIPPELAARGAIELARHRSRIEARFAAGY